MIAPPTLDVVRGRMLQLLLLLLAAMALSLVPSALAGDSAEDAAAHEHGEGADAASPTGGGCPCPPRGR
ncbi:hypothetical protein LZ198_38455 [Myxococcus sp. K15C18031901]|uniref:hypothetical protein n=1 Tax=Myxococcus dinghuensis TaxID=2906761 RepID=UPI0020A70E0B|nr:hypothetical protein [Myxococcus dinghuensis]MCP3104764.1 hypothetical protein [Myxococcus dinghuensis]